MKTAAAIIIAAFLLALSQRSPLQLQHALVDRDGHRQNLGMVPLSTFAPRISPDGRQLSFDTQEAEPSVWIADSPSLQSMRRLP